MHARTAVLDGAAAAARKAGRGRGKNGADDELYALDGSRGAARAARRRRACAADPLRWSVFRTDPVSAGQWAATEAACVAGLAGVAAKCGGELGGEGPILVGGDETTRHVITEGALALIEHPDQRRLLAENPGKLTVAVEELLRWVSPIKNMNRTALRDTELQGQKIQEGDKVLLLYHAANLDEAAFDAPGRFDVERRPNNHVAFGGDLHLGLVLADALLLDHFFIITSVRSKLDQVDRTDLRSGDVMLTHPFYRRQRNRLGRGGRGKQ